MTLVIMALLNMMQLLQVNITGNLTNAIQLPVVTLANAFGDLTSTLILITLMIAMTIRTSSEFIEKYIKGEISTFNRKYIVTALIAFISSLPIAMTLFPQGAEIFLAYFGSWGLAGALFMVGVYGYGWNHGVNKIASLTGHFFTATKQVEGQDSITGEQQQQQQPVSQQTPAGNNPQSTQPTGPA